MKFKINSCALVLALLTAPFVHADAHGKWSYSGESAPDKWGTLNNAFATCEEGFNQSPIDIQKTIKGELPPLSMSFNAKDKSIINNGHTIQIDVNDGDHLVVDGTTFTLKQFHFHTPSENLIDGRTYPLEIHFVNSSDQGELTVIGVMIDEGQENPVIADILNNLPARVNQAQKLTKPLALAHLMPGDKHYYRFSGSLTTPPCTEGVRWLVMKDPVYASKAQIAAFEAALEQQNSRPVQPLNGRVVIH